MPPQEPTERRNTGATASYLLSLLAQQSEVVSKTLKCIREAIENEFGYLGEDSVNKLIINAERVRVPKELVDKLINANNNVANLISFSGVIENAPDLSTTERPSALKNYEEDLKEKFRIFEDLQNEIITYVIDYLLNPQDTWEDGTFPFTENAPDSFGKNDIEG